MQELMEFRIDYCQWREKIKAREMELDALLKDGWRVYSSQLYNRHGRGGVTVVKIHFLERQAQCSPSITASTL